MTGGSMVSADVWTALPAAVPLDDRATQCRRAADYMQAHPGCTTRELGEGADLGSVTKVISEMPRYGYSVRTERSSGLCMNGTRRRRGAARYFLEGRPVNPQRDLFEPA